MNRETVSVIIPVFNRAARLKEAVMSVLLQTYRNIELIIVDDGSTDDTNIVANELQRKWPLTIKVIRQANAGPGPARQLGTNKSKGEFIQYLDSDDLLLHNKFEFQVDSLISHPDCGISYGISYQADYSFTPPLISGPIRSTGAEIFTLFPRLLNERWWTTSSPLYRRSLIEKIGPWKSLLNEEDWEFDARAAEISTLLIWVAEGVSIRRINLGKDHLSQGGCSDAKKISDRVIAKQLLFGYAVNSGLKRTRPEMQIFARECFLLSRQCASIGLDIQSKIMFKLSKKACNIWRKNGLDYIIYGTMGNLIGWSRTGRLASKLRDML